jgi:signal transduction histidine kinase
VLGRALPVRDASGAIVRWMGTCTEIHELKRVQQALVLDRTRITQVVANLLHNAAKYTPVGGRIEVVLEQDGDEAVVRVHDNGQGMTPQLIACVFDLFIQADATSESRDGGLGVGLSLARSLAQLHGGRLTAHSAGVGLGSTLELRLPLVASVAEPAA